MMKSAYFLLGWYLGAAAGICVTLDGSWQWVILIPSIIATIIVIVLVDREMQARD